MDGQFVCEFIGFWGPNRNMETNTRDVVFYKTVDYRSIYTKMFIFIDLHSCLPRFRPLPCSDVHSCLCNSLHCLQSLRTMLNH